MGTTSKYKNWKIKSPVSAIVRGTVIPRRIEKLGEICKQYSAMIASAKTSAFLFESIEMAKSRVQPIEDFKSLKAATRFTLATL